MKLEEKGCICLATCPDLCFDKNPALIEGICMD